ncbi:hypothetical protein SAMN05428961_10238 [Paenibacillus sp. OK060]|nr:hypothetical protein SAMN05428961_10238 [Paenibacillus sp. OK060]
MGLRVLDPETKKDVDLFDSRIKAGVLFATAGQGGDSLTTFAAENMSHLNVSFTHMITPTLVIVGDQDYTPQKYQLTVRGPEWMSDPYFLSPGAESLLTLFGAEHSLSGIPGYEVTETTDENPEHVALIQLVSWAYLCHALDIEHDSWTAVQKALSEDPNPIGRIESK